MKNTLTDSTGRLYHIHLRRKDVGKIAILSGDPDRIPIIAERFEDARSISSKREYTAYGGFVNGEYVIAMSTGIGGPAAAIAVEELARLGVKLMIRVGTCGAIDSRARNGTLVIAEASVRLDGTTMQYVVEGYPAAATPEVVIALKQSAASLKMNFLSGLAASTDAFYAGQGRRSYGGYFPNKAIETVSDLRAARVLCFEMESSTLFTLGRLFGLETGAILTVLGDKMTDDRLASKGITDAIEVSVEAIKRLNGSALERCT